MRSHGIVVADIPWLFHGVREVMVKLMQRAVRFLPGILVLAVGAVPASAATFQNRGIAELEGLDKITARVWTFEVPVGHAVRFGTLEIVALACRETPPEEPPESAAFLEVVDHRTNEEASSLFQGWMFASNPALSALEHPVYDVWLKDCK